MEWVYDNDGMYTKDTLAVVQYDKRWAVHTKEDGELLAVFNDELNAFEWADDLIGLARIERRKSGVAT